MSNRAVRKVWIVAALVVIAALALALTSVAKKNAAAAENTVVNVVEHATTDKITTDAPPTGDSVGDVLTFANAVFDQKDSKKVGRDQGMCIRTVAQKAFECWWTTFLPRGQITVEGPFYDASSSTLAITGGTRAYRTARGTMNLIAINSSEFRFVFRLAE